MAAATTLFDCQLHRQGHSASGVGNAMKITLTQLASSLWAVKRLSFSRYCSLSIAIAPEHLMLIAVDVVNKFHSDATVLAGIEWRHLSLGGSVAWDQAFQAAGAGRDRL
jgi:hypothetical protein